ncbi:glycosyltransferase family 4 protein [Olivibacter sitiensis]|uniref:glycosyltransferase family 4 protein n=1 Tax=Olivibacter sitiensis TaxID=376470 RepID=UPI0003F89E8C|nr:glycosyltransferase family 4 protein [Olivibacter sitiensis]
MKIALIAPGIVSLRFGATKNRIELAASLKKYGWETDVMGNLEIGLEQPRVNREIYRQALKNFLIKHAHLYDVVLYEYDTLPFDRSLFSRETLFVARPALLSYHLDNIKIPLNFRAKLNKIVRRQDKVRQDNYKNIEKTLMNCDLIQVQNHMDKDLLVKKGYDGRNIVVVPNGITEERFSHFTDASVLNVAKEDKIAFVGTFDFRKGAMDFPYVLKYLLSRKEGIKMKLLGTKGLLKTEKEVLNFFPKKFHSFLEVVPSFEPNNLPNLLADCKVGVFPSYVESFGFGALEMMAAGLPVVGYNSPGPCDFLLEDLKVPIGNRKELAKKLHLLLDDEDYLAEKRRELSLITRNYHWDVIAEQASKNYIHHLKLMVN